jgi:CheY-like chemotaxis protein/two-component sensor histidine kinase
LLHNKQVTTAQLNEGLTAITSSAEAQKAMIDDLLDTSRIISGKMRLQLQDVGLVPLIQESIDAILPAARAKEISVVSDLGNDVGVVHIDSDRVRQVVWNLLANSVKFSPKGSRINVGVWRRDDAVEIRVADNGRGISADFLPYVFDRFRQADASSTRRHGGLGLGLDISKQLVELHGGTIEVQSDGPGKGATFIVKLPVGKVRSTRLAPAAQSNSQPSENQPAATVSGMRVLLIEDDARTRNALAIIMQDAGAEVTEVDSADAAMDAYRKNKPDVIISDIGLADEDGYALIPRIRQEEKSSGQPEVPAIALSAFARDEDRLRAMQSGFQKYLGKPIDPKALLESLSTTMNTR